MSNGLISPEETLYDAIKVIEGNARRLAVVITAERFVIGTLTDGDIRRCLLSGGKLDTPVKKAMNPDPVLAPATATDAYIFELLVRYHLRALPLISPSGQYVRAVHISDLHPFDDVEIVVGKFELAVIMAGGEGKRLRPLTENLPKPMVEIGGIPILERQITKLGRSGIRCMYISTNYLPDIIEEHFGDGSRFGVSIEYLRETRKLGTAGSLALLPVRPSGPILVMNGDILTTSDFGHLYDFHVEQKSMITAGAVNYRVEIPYGIIDCKGPDIIGIREKPSQQFLCNAGIYAISPDVLSELPSEAYIDMPDLIQKCLAKNFSVGVFPIHEFWTDIGTKADLVNAQQVFSRKPEFYN